MQRSVQKHVFNFDSRGSLEANIATDQPDYNIVNNNGYAQVVPHVHWHVGTTFSSSLINVSRLIKLSLLQCVPAPKLNVTSIQSDNSSMPIGPLIRATTYCFSDELSAGFREIQRREELDDNDAIHLAQTIANAIRAETESRL